MKTSVATLLAIASTIALAQAAPYQYGDRHPSPASVLVSKASAVSDAKVFINDYNQNIVLNKPEVSSLKAVNYADIAARAFGLSPVNPTFDASQVMTNTLSLAKASLTVAIPSVGGNDLAFDGTAFDLTADWTSSPLSLFNTAIRGVEAAHHGITGCTIPRPTLTNPSITVPAFSEKAMPKVPSTSRSLAAVFGKDAMISCASSSNKWAFCDAGVSVDTTATSAADAFAALGLSVVDGKVTVNGVAISADAFAALATELAYIKALPATISPAVVADNIPDSYTVALAGVKALSATELKAVTPLITATVAEASEALNTLYGGVITSVFALGTPQALTQEDEAAALSFLSVDPETVVNAAAFPVITATASRRLCANANAAAKAQGSDLSFTCTSAHAPLGEDAVFFEVSSLADPITPKEMDDIRRYQIVLWFVIGIIAVVYYAIYATMTMPVAQDPALFGNLSPTWTKRS